jgi:hypothetical protein
LLRIRHFLAEAIRNSIRVTQEHPEWLDSLFADDARSSESKNENATTHRLGRKTRPVLFSLAVIG